MAQTTRTNGALSRHKVEREKPFVRGIVKKISREWSNELKGNHRPMAEEGILKLLIRALAKEVAKELREEGDEQFGLIKDTLIATNKGPAAKGLAKAEAKLAKLIKVGHPDDAEEEEEDEKEARGAKYPNLKYRQPKYKNVESILKFVESKEDKGGVKLVIMNFND